MKKPAKQRKNKKAIKRIAELLRDNVLESFAWYGIEASVGEESSSEPAKVEESPSTPEKQGEEVQDDEEEYSEEYEEEEYYFDPADVQGALDEAISIFIAEQLVPEFSDPKKAPALSDIFAVLFGKQSELRKRAEYFEELISGYEDRAHIDDLREACSVLEEIVEEIMPEEG